MVAVWSRRWGRECFCNSLRPEGGKLLQFSRGRGPYLLQISNRKVEVTHPKNMRVFKSETQVKHIRIKYRITSDEESIIQKEGNNE